MRWHQTLVPLQVRCRHLWLWLKVPSDRETRQLRLNWSMLLAV
jgi:hypothetical protein